jgi:hypothetical protein
MVPVPVPQRWCLSLLQEPALPGGKAGAGQGERRIPVAQAGEAEWTGEGDQELAAAGTPARGEGFHRQGEGLGSYTEVVKVLKELIFLQVEEIFFCQKKTFGMP